MSGNLFGAAPGYGVTFGCTCESCTATNALADAGFAAWPRGDGSQPKRISQAAYTSHIAAAKQGAAQGFHFTIRPEPVWPAWVTCQINMPVAQAPAYVLDWIARSYAWSGMQEHYPAGGGAASVRLRTVPRLLGMAQQLRAERLQERKAA